MATDSSTVSVTNTLSSTTADTVTLTAGWTTHAHLLVVVNHDDTNTIWFTWNHAGTPAVAVAEADDAVPVLPGSSTSVRLPRTNNPVVVSVVGNGDKYTCAVLPTVGL